MIGNNEQRTAEMKRMRRDAQDYIEDMAAAIRAKDIDKLSRATQQLVNLGKDSPYPEVVLEVLSMACGSVAIQEREIRMEEMKAGKAQSGSDT